MFFDPLFLALSLIPIILFAIRWRGYPARSSQVRISTFDFLAESGSTSTIPYRISILLRLFACLILVVIYAREGAVRRKGLQEYQSSALAIALDISTSMTADDFAPGNRLEEAKASLTEFIASQSQVEIGLIQFAAVPRLIMPATLEHKPLTDALAKVQPAAYDEDGTAIGSALVSAVNRLRYGPWGKRRILLLTDGVNNKGSISPIDAARVAKSFQVTVDAIGMGTDAPSRFWAPSATGNTTQLEARIQIDDKALEALTQTTGGIYQRVRSTDELRRALSKLKQMPDDVFRKADQPDSSMDWTKYAALAALFALCLEFLLTNYFFPELPE
jgi:Ca-activated chloride channel homolog